MRKSPMTLICSSPSAPSSAGSSESSTGEGSTSIAASTGWSMGVSRKLPITSKSISSPTASGANPAVAAAATVDEERTCSAAPASTVKCASKSALDSSTGSAALTLKDGSGRSNSNTLSAVATGTVIESALTPDTAARLSKSIPCTSSNENSGGAAGDANPAD